MIKELRRQTRDSEAIQRLATAVSSCDSSGWRSCYRVLLGHLAEARVTVGTVQQGLRSEEAQTLLEIPKEAGREEEIPWFSPTPSLKCFNQ